ncbi:hypothetical protein HYALB_00005782 [Hymenoscyphus albidus]|uniref:Uncharacterized protein n=1 Tax=Hymenoscyphus albidus TaxID=595503 RepID=A0A9N9LKX3_9HELO|nr:hypothetical protein HYALB_00005782 [Hymenoscyphus albidus]
MPRSRRRRDFLRPQASRVEKHRRSRNARPAWFARLKRIITTREIRVEDYDEDISELEESTDDESDHGDGSDGSLYSQLKEEREERKFELEQLDDQKTEMLNCHKAKEAEVHAAYRGFKKARRKAKKNGSTISIDSILGQEFELFSSDYVEEFGMQGSRTARKRVSFYSREFIKSGTENVEVEGKKMVIGDVYLDSEVNTELESFPLPTRARRKNLNVDCTCGDGSLRFKFFGNGYLMLSIPRSLIRGDAEILKSDAPEFVPFVGTLIDPKKEKRKRIEAAVRIESMRSFSPKKNWFNMNHPMGASVSEVVMLSMIEKLGSMK